MNGCAAVQTSGSGWGHFKLTVWGAIASAAATASEVAARIPYAVPLPPPLPSSVDLPSATAATTDLRNLYSRDHEGLNMTRAE